MTISRRVAVDADWPVDLVRFKLIILNSRGRRGEVARAEATTRRGPTAVFVVERRRDTNRPPPPPPPPLAERRKNARKQERAIENLHPEDRREGHRPNQALHEREVSGVSVASLNRYLPKFRYRGHKNPERPHDCSKDQTCAVLIVAKPIYNTLLVLVLDAKRFTLKTRRYRVSRGG
ncbi:hypothetical protein F2P81_005534 [Scophthalmus maximus]|uniref:Uncharacterized protein n=1 Tax=Scophthalmus maximus TaxID=52904 RepID=A0A6A4TIX9_SCOMX|nr:hypothetical protein F2P81_005534 [Scophthalmus maximus]